MLSIHLWAAMFALETGIPVTSTFALEYVDPNFHGRCNLPTNHIVINQLFYGDLPYVHQRELVYHEIAHCVCNLRHLQGSIMQPRKFVTHLNGSNWERLMIQLKQMCYKSLGMDN